MTDWSFQTTNGTLYGKLPFPGELCPAVLFQHVSVEMAYIIVLTYNYLSPVALAFLPQLLTSDAASTFTRNSEADFTDSLAPPMPNRNSVFSTLSYDSEVGRLYASA